MKPKVFLRKLLRGGNKISDVFNIQPLSIDESDISNKYISTIDLNNDEFIFNDAFINTYYLHLSIFTYYYIKNKSSSTQPIDRVVFITNAVDKIKAYVKCYVLYKLLEKIKNNTFEKNKVFFNAIKSTDAFDDFDETNIVFADKDSEFTKMKKILHAIAIIIKYGGNTDDNLTSSINSWCSNYDNFTIANSQILNGLNEGLSNAQTLKKNRKVEEGIIDKKSKVLDEIKKEVENRLIELKDKFKTDYSDLKTSNNTVKLFSEAKIRNVEDIAIDIIKNIRLTNTDDSKQSADAYAAIIINNLQNDNEKSTIRYDELFEEYDKLFEDERKQLTIIGDIKDNQNDFNKALEFYKFYYEKYLKGKLLQLSDNELNGFIVGGGNKKVKSKKGGVNDENSVIINLIKGVEFNITDPLLSTIKNNQKISKTELDNEKKKNEDLDKTINLINKAKTDHTDSTDEFKIIKSLVKTYEILIKLEKDESTIVEPLDIELVHDDLKSVALNLRKVEIIYNTVNSDTVKQKILGGIDDNTLKSLKINVSSTIKREYNRHDIENIRDTLEKLNKYEEILKNAEDLIKLANDIIEDNETKKGGLKKKKKGGGKISDDLNDIESKYNILNSELRESSESIKTAIDLVKNQLIKQYNDKNNYIKGRTSVVQSLDFERLKADKHTEIDNKINEATEALKNELENYITEIDENASNLQNEIRANELERDEILTRIKENLSLILKNKPIIFEKLENIRSLLQEKIDRINQEILKESQEINALNEQIENSDIQELENAINSKKAENELNTQLRTDLEANVNQLQQNLNEATATNADLLNQLADVTQHLGQLEPNSLLSSLEYDRKDSIINELDTQPSLNIEEYSNFDNITANENVKEMLNKIKGIDIYKTSGIRNFKNDFYEILQSYLQHEDTNIKNFITRLYWYSSINNSLFDYNTNEVTDINKVDDNFKFIKLKNNIVLVNLFKNVPEIQNNVFLRIENTTSLQRHVPSNVNTENDENEDYEDANDEIQEDGDREEINEYMNNVSNLLLLLNIILKRAKEVDISNILHDEIYNTNSSEFINILGNLIHKLLGKYLSDYNGDINELQNIDAINRKSKDLIKRESKIKINESDYHNFNDLLTTYFNKKSNNYTFDTINVKKENILQNFNTEKIILKNYENYENNDIMKAINIILRICGQAFAIINQKIVSSVANMSIEKLNQEQKERLIAYHAKLKQDELDEMAAKEKIASDERERKIREANEAREAKERKKRANAELVNEDIKTGKQDYRKLLTLKLSTNVISDINNINRLLKEDANITLYNLINTYNDGQRDLFNDIATSVKLLIALNQDIKTDLEKLYILKMKKNDDDEHNFKLNNISPYQTTPVLIGNETDRKNKTVKITLNNSNKYIFIRSPIDDSKLAYVQVFKKLYMKLADEIQLEFDDIDKDEIDLRQELTGGARVAEEPNNIFNTYIIMVLNKIMEMNNDGLAAFTDKVGIVAA